MPVGEEHEVTMYYIDKEGKYHEIHPLGEMPEMEPEFTFTMEDLWQTEDPPRDGYYIVTLGNVIGIAIWEEGKWWITPHEQTDEVTAWMPVPKPWKG